MSSNDLNNNDDDEEFARLELPQGRRRQSSNKRHPGTHRTRSGGGVENIENDDVDDERHDDVEYATPSKQEDEGWKKFARYELRVSAEQDDRATEIMLCQFGRPHMRAFHMAWWSFFVAFFIWFAIGTIMPEIQATLHLTKQEIWTASVLGVAGTIVVRLIVGPLCDKYGPRIPFSIMLLVASIPTALTGLVVHNAFDLAILRLFIGVAGGTFVTTEYWTSRMFAKEIVGTANGLVAGWGNLGAGVTQLVMGSILLPLFKLFCDNDEMAWRTVCIVPAIVGMVTGVVLFLITDDAPKGNYAEMKQHGVHQPEQNVSPLVSFRRGALNVNSWIFFVQYATCFGVELAMYNAAALYFVDEFGQSTEAAGAITAIFGWLNLFARGLGGIASDYYFWKYGMRGRIWVQTICLLAEGGLVLVFANTSSLGGAIAVLVFFSVFVQAAEGTSFGIVPYIDPPATGAISGIVGAGGNVGAVTFSMGFRQLNYRDAFVLMGSSILASAALSFFVFIEGHDGGLISMSFFFPRAWGKRHHPLITNLVQRKNTSRSDENSSAATKEEKLLHANGADPDEGSPAVVNVVLSDSSQSASSYLA